MVNVYLYVVFSALVVLVVVLVWSWIDHKLEEQRDKKWYELFQEEHKLHFDTYWQDKAKRDIDWLEGWTTKEYDKEIRDAIFNDVLKEYEEKIKTKDEGVQHIISLKDDMGL